MREILKRTGLTALLLVPGALAAQAPGWSMAVSGNVMTDSVFGMGKSFGATVDGAYTWDSEAAALPLRVSVAYATFPASGQTTLAGTGPSTYKIGLQDFQVGLDGFASLPVESLKLFFGFTLNQWLADATSSYWVPDDSAAGGSFQSGKVSGTVKGIKLGLHLGLEHPFSERISGLVVLQLSQLGTSSAFMVQSDPNWADGSGNVGVNPCWVQVGVRYHF
jgi:hypothetical protein